jgi:F0F1-type ATP synthase assembly protein I
MPSVNLVRRIGAFLDFFFWSLFDPWFLYLLWLLGILVLGLSLDLGVLVSWSFVNLQQTDTPHL